MSRMRCIAVAFFLFALTFHVSPALAQNDVLRVVPQADLKILDPNWTTATITSIYALHVYDSLLATNDKGQVQPQMASYEVSSDGLTYTFTLRDGLMFHDGQPVRAADVAASIKRWLAVGTLGKRMAGQTAGVDVVNGKTVRIRLSKPFGLLPELFGRLSGGPYIFPERLASIDAKEQMKDVVGSGPFKFVESEWVPGSKVVFEKFDGYKPRSEAASWNAGGKRVKVQRMEWNIIKDGATRLAALQRNEVDVVEDPPVELLQTLQGNKNVTVAPLDPLGRYGLLVINHLYPPFNNPKARKALEWLTNQEETLTAIAGTPDNFTVCPALFLCGGPLETMVGTEALAGYDVDKAKALLKEGGYNGEPIVLMVSTTHPFLNAAGLVMAQNLRKAGVNVDLQQMDWGTLTSRRILQDDPNKEPNKGWHLFHTAGKAYALLTPPFLNQVSGMGRKGWYGWATDPQIDAYRNQFAEAVTASQKKDTVEKLQAEIFKNVTYVNYGYWTNPAAFRSNLQGLLLSPIPVYWNVSK